MSAPVLVETFETDCGNHAVLWTHDDQITAEASGWYLDEEQGLICKDDDSSAFEDAESAREHVRQLAHNGDEHAIRAMIFDAAASRTTWFNHLRETDYNG